MSYIKLAWIWLIKGAFLDRWWCFLVISEVGIFKGQSSNRKNMKAAEKEGVQNNVSFLSWITDWNRSSIELCENGCRSLLPSHPLIMGNLFILPGYNAEYPGERRSARDSFLNVKFL